MPIQLKGITWNHSRGYVPLVATAQRYMEMHPDVEIIWEKRSLQAFADYPIKKLAETYDLLIIDHPWAGFAADSSVLLPLQEHLPESYLQDQADNSVGKSHESYNFDGYQTALAVDAAAPVASYRPDLLERYELKLPETWEDLLDLARKGRVVLPSIPVDTLMNFYSLYVTQGGVLCREGGPAVSREEGSIALEQLRELVSLCTPEIFGWNPIAVYNNMSTRDDFVYCPFAYGYSNYSRNGYSRNILLFTDLVSFGSHGKLSTTLGGAGLALSSKCRNLNIALDYAMYVADSECQSTLYAENGGQPGHRKAWLDKNVNRLTHNFFINTLPALDRAYLRPRYNGYLYFQDQAGDVVLDYVRNGGNIRTTLEKLDILFRESLTKGC